MFSILGAFATFALRSLRTLRASLWNSYISGGCPVSKPYADIDSFLPSATAALAPRSEGGIAMLDITMLAIGLGLFVATVGYCYLCDRL